MKSTEVTANNYNVPQSIRAQRLSSFSGVTEDVISRPVSVEHALLLGKAPCVYNANMDVESEGSDQLRPTTYIPNLRELEIDITYFCNLTCAGCSRSSAQAPSDQHMPLSMIRDFLEESEEGDEMGMLHISGGEPTNIQISLKLTMLDEWFMEHSPETDLKVITNGVSKKMQKNIMNISQHWRNLRMKIRTNWIARSTQATLSRSTSPRLIYLNGETRISIKCGCYITQDSGIGLTPYGYFHCAIAGGMERIMKLGHGFDSFPTTLGSFSR